MLEEIFKDIEGYENLYKISNQGRVLSLCNGKDIIRKLIKDKDNYLQVTLYKQGKPKTYKVHRLVAQAFIDNPNNYPIINHKDEDKTNNTIQNLEWCTNVYNINYGSHNQRVAESNTNNPKISKKVLCIETGKIYLSAHQVQRELGFDRSGISKCCRGKYKQMYGFHWRYI